MALSLLPIYNIRLSSANLSLTARFQTRSHLRAGKFVQLSSFHGLRITPHTRQFSAYPRPKLPAFVPVGTSAKTFGRKDSNNLVKGGALWYVPFHETLGECLVTFPPRGSAPLKGIINFAGGAFVGAAPQLTYSLFIDLLAKANYVVVATPYPLTFDHSAMAQTVHRRFQDCLRLLDERSEGDTWPWDARTADLPIYAVGHSNGALLMLLAACLCKDGRTPVANVLVSFNNKPASEAIPYFNQVGPALVRAAPLVDALPFAGIARRLADEATRMVSASPLPPGVSSDDVAPFLPIVDQIGPIFEQITSGISEFTPTPSENCTLVASSYSCAHTLLVKFSVDQLDETDALYELLAPVVEREGGSLRLAELEGMHLSPAAQDVRWRVGQVYTPVDAIAQVVKSNALADIKKTAGEIVSWLDELSSTSGTTEEWR